MTNGRKRRRSLGTRVGASPGALTISTAASPTTVRVVRIETDRCDVKENVKVDALRNLPAGPGITWIDVVGLGTEAMLLDLRQTFDVPTLAMADVVNVPQRPKLELFPEALLVVLQIPRPLNEMDLDQFSFFARGSTVISFREHEDKVFDALLERLNDKASRLLSAGPDYLLYRLIDTVFDGCFPHLDRLNDRLDSIEAQAVERPTAKPLHELYSIRRELGILLRSAMPARDVFSSIVRECTGYFTPEIMPYMRDLFDHASQVVDLAQHHRQAASDIQELVVANLDLKMNQVMKVLTAVTVIFIPLSFVTGLYGMNFKHMPELEWTWGYPAVLVLLAAIAWFIIARLRKAGWTKLEEE